jgi:hypothetical protein
LRARKIKVNCRSEKNKISGWKNPKAKLQPAKNKNEIRQRKKTSRRSTKQKIAG